MWQTYSVWKKQRHLITELQVINKMVRRMSRDHLMFVAFQSDNDLDVSLFTADDTEIDVLQVIEQIGHLSTLNTTFVIFLIVLRLKDLHLQGFIFWRSGKFELRDKIMTHSATTDVKGLRKKDPKNRLSNELYVTWKTTNL